MAHRHDEGTGGAPEDGAGVPRGTGADTGATLGGLALVEADDREALAERLAGDIAARLARALGSRGAASLVVSGGSTPAPMLAHLARADIDWSGVAVTLADERWVPLDDAASNEALLRRTLLVERAAAARFVSLYREADEPDEAALADIDSALDAMPAPYTVVVLGMGNDGHTASLFPDAPELEQAMTTRSRVAAMRPPSAAQTRITLTRSALLDSEARLLHITGADKRDVLERALADEPRLAPVGRVLGESPADVTVYWSP